MEFKIKAGKHYHSNWMARIQAITNIREKKSITKTAMFTESCWYPESYVKYAGHNKLFGGGAILHKQNSARFVWQPDFENQGKINIFSYVYKDGDWTDEYLFTTTVGAWEKLVLTRSHIGYTFRWDGGFLNVSHDKPTLLKPLQPYFGGQDTAYRTMIIHLK